MVPQTLYNLSQSMGAHLEQKVPTKDTPISVQGHLLNHVTSSTPTLTTFTYMFTNVSFLYVNTRVDSYVFTRLLILGPAGPPKSMIWEI